MIHKLAIARQCALDIDLQSQRQTANLQRSRENLDFLQSLSQIQGDLRNRVCVSSSISNESVCFRSAFDKRLVTRSSRAPLECPPVYAVGRSPQIRMLKVAIISIGPLVRLERQCNKVEREDE